MHPMNNAFDIPQRVLILGAGSDIAPATALALAANGTREYVLAARHPDALDMLVEQLRELHATSVERFHFDANDHDRHQALVDYVWSQPGHVDLALVAFGSLTGETDTDDSTRAAMSLVTTNYVSIVSIIETMVPRFRAQGTGTIAVLSSVAATRPRADNYVYASSKAGLDSYARRLADAVAPDVHVMVVRPGFVTTKMTADETPAPFSIAPERVATDIVEGLRQRSDIVWSPPIVRGVMGGLRLLPTPVHRRVTKLVIASRTSQPEAI